MSKATTIVVGTVAISALLSIGIVAVYVFG